MAATFSLGTWGYVSPGVGMPGYSQLTAPVPYETRYFEETGRRLSCSGMYEARESDPAAARLWDEFIRNLASFCIQMQFTFDTEKIFIGGGISGWAPFIPLLREEIGGRWTLSRWTSTARTSAPAPAATTQNLLGAVYGLKTAFNI